MANRNYVNGRAFEYRTRDKALKQGAVYVMRAAQSKGAVDLIVLWPQGPDVGWGIIHNPPWLVQCKRDGRLSAREEIELKSLGAATGALPVLAKAGKNGRGVEFVFLNEQEC